MKKIILSLVGAAMLVFGFSSCQHQTMESMEVTIYSDDWVVPNGKSYLACSVRWDALDEDVVYHGTVNAYVYEENGRQSMLPYVYSIDFSTYDEFGNNINPAFVTENLRFEVAPGIITFIMQDFDYELPEGDIPKMTFRVVAIGE